jgi:hypothetical protein
MLSVPFAYSALLSLIAIFLLSLFIVLSRGNASKPVVLFGGVTVCIGALVFRFTAKFVMFKFDSL